MQIYFEENKISSAWYPFQIYDLYFSSYRDLVSHEIWVEKQGFRNQQQN